MVPRRILYFGLVILLLFSNLSEAFAQDENDDHKFFPKHGHSVSGEFLDFYNSVDDPERLFGAPITDAFPDRIRPGITIQYFERVRMDLDPALPKGKRVHLANLGSWLYDEDHHSQPVDFPDSGPMCRVFSNGKKVCYAFLQFYDRYNGPVLFGQPVSDLEYTNDRLVQYFENVRMEWRSEMPINQRVVLSLIGRIDFDLRIGDDTLTKPKNIGSNQAQRELRLKAFVDRPLVTAGDRIKIYVIAQDQFNDPWENVPVVVTLKYPGKPAETRRLERLTGEDGITLGEFAIPEISPNQVIDVIVEATVVNGPSGSTSTWLRTWW